MANVGGGVLVWGIDAPKNVAANLSLVPDVEGLAAKLTEFHHFITDPPVPGVRIRPIPLSANTKEGFVVCLIPEGNVKPYETLYPRKAFYMRFGDETKEPPLSVLRVLFRPALRTEAELTMHIEREKGEDRSLFQVHCVFKNTGRTTIEHATLKITAEDVQLNSYGVRKVGNKEVEMPVGEFLHPSQTCEFPLYVKTLYGHVAHDFTVSLFQRNCEAISVVHRFDSHYTQFVEKNTGVNPIVTRFVAGLEK